MTFNGWWDEFSKSLRSDLTPEVINTVKDVAFVAYCAGRSDGLDVSERVIEQMKETIELTQLGD